MPVRAQVVLNDQEREVFERWARRPKSSQAFAFRCRIVLAAAEGRSSQEIAAERGCTGSTVGKWLARRARQLLVASIRSWIADWNDNPKPFVWHKSADQILDSVAAYCQRINDSGH